MVGKVSGAFGAACLVTGAAAADIVDIRWSVSNPVLTPDNPTSTVLMTATWSEHDAICFALAYFDILGRNAGGAEVRGVYDGGGPFFLGHNMLESVAETDQPDEDNNLPNGWAFCPLFFGGVARTPMKWWFTYEATDFTPRTVGYTAEFSEFWLYTDTFNVIQVEPSVAPTTFRVVPAPAAVLTLIPLGLCRRR